jgi:hypothetical protein
MVVRLFIELESGFRAGRRGDGEDGAGPVGALGGDDCAAHCRDETAPDGETEAGTGALPTSASLGNGR